MKNLKLIVSSLVVTSVVLSSPIRVNAQWKQDSNGWWNTEGSSYSIGWKQIEGKWYYFLENGYMAHDTTVEGYRLGNDGSWIQTIQNNSTENSDVELEKLPQEYHFDDAKKDGDVLQILGGIKYNIEKLDKFMENYKDKKASVGDRVRIWMSGEDGGPTIRDLIINSEGTIKFREDNTRDWMSSNKDRIIREYNVVDIYTEDNTSGYRTYYMKTERGGRIFLGNSHVH